jgi:hypothetical protein
VAYTIASAIVFATIITTGFVALDELLMEVFMFVPNNTSDN